MKTFKKVIKKPSKAKYKAYYLEKIENEEIKKYNTKRKSKDKIDVIFSNDSDFDFE